MKKVLYLVAELMLLSTVALPIGYAQSIIPEPQSVKIVIDEKNHGSGFYIGNGLYVTSHHVVFDMIGLDIVSKNENGQSAKLRYLDGRKEYDIAVLTGPEDFAPELKVDCDPEFSIGMDLRTLGNPMTMDFIQFSIKVAGKRTGLNIAREIVPLDGTIIPGMSGGPVLKDNGQVVGVNTGVAVDYRKFDKPILPLSFITPSDVICDLLDGTLPPDAKTKISKQ